MQMNQFVNVFSFYSYDLIILFHFCPAYVSPNYNINTTSAQRTPHWFYFTGVFNIVGLYALPFNVVVQHLFSFTHVNESINIPLSDITLRNNTCACPLNK